MKALLDFLFPPRCIGCDRRGDWLCDRCRAGFGRIRAPRCQVCAAPTGGVAVCPLCWRDPPRFTTIVAEFQFEGVIRKGIHLLKYRRATYLARPLINAVLDSEVALPAVDLIVPVPLHPARLRSRGYNQASLLAHVAAERLNRPVVDGSLVRVKDTHAQISLPATQRWSNVQDAFEAVASRTEISGQRILLVDDVATTTATLRAASMALLRAGVAEISCLVIARSTHDRVSDIVG